MSDQQKINSFIRNYAANGYKRDINKINLSSDNTFEHNLRVCEVCCHLLKLGIPFFTEMRLKCGLRPDICVPTHIRKIIEILHTETVTDFDALKRRKLPNELMYEVFLIKTSEPFNVKQIL